MRRWKEGRWSKGTEKMWSKGTEKESVAHHSVHHMLSACIPKAKRAVVTKRPIRRIRIHPSIHPSPSTYPKHNIILQRVVHEYAGHAKGVAGFVLFPETGHMLLSAGMDGKVKIWDAEGSHGYKCLRTYAGHDKGVRGVHVSETGLDLCLGVSCCEADGWVSASRAST